ncbi:hypothetical protein R1flu_004352 [Riccia fluitans]|uniref:Retrovirus-related Pol polyprotein from transposon TNT 1-94-like beta-barrel domain-containing protein n=1 Tax=Riccia fluitans TaxID=41844 RepID=A0ABD1YQL8_9MARC
MLCYKTRYLESLRSHQWKQSLNCCTLLRDSPKEVAVLEVVQVTHLRRLVLQVPRAICIADTARRRDTFLSPVSSCRRKKRDSKPVAGVVVSAAADSQNKVLMASQIGGSDQDHSWVVDTGATDHMACKREYFHTYEPLHSPKFVYLGDNSVHPMVGIGNVVVKLSSGEKVTIEQVYHVPSLFKNLFSGKQFAKKKGTLVFTDTCKR